MQDDNSSLLGLNCSTALVSMDGLEFWPDPIVGHDDIAYLDLKDGEQIPNKIVYSEGLRQTFIYSSNNLLNISGSFKTEQELEIHFISPCGINLQNASFMLGSKIYLHTSFMFFNTRDASYNLTISQANLTIKDSTFVDSLNLEADILFLENNNNFNNLSAAISNQTYINGIEQGRAFTLSSNEIYFSTDTSLNFAVIDISTSTSNNQELNGKIKANELRFNFIGYLNNKAALEATDSLQITTNGSFVNTGNITSNEDLSINGSIVTNAASSLIKAVNGSINATIINNDSQAFISISELITTANELHNRGGIYSNISQLHNITNVVKNYASFYSKGSMSFIMSSSGEIHNAEFAKIEVDNGLQVRAQDGQNISISLIQNYAGKIIAHNGTTEIFVNEIRNLGNLTKRSDTEGIPNGEIIRERASLLAASWIMYGDKIIITSNSFTNENSLTILAGSITEFSQNIQILNIAMGLVYYKSWTTSWVETKCIIGFCYYRTVYVPHNEDGIHAHLPSKIVIANCNSTIASLQNFIVQEASKIDMQELTSSFTSNEQNALVPADFFKSLQETISTGGKQIGFLIGDHLAKTPEIDLLKFLLKRGFNPSTTIINKDLVQRIAANGHFTGNLIAPPSGSNELASNNNVMVNVLCSDIFADADTDDKIGIITLLHRLGYSFDNVINILATPNFEQELLGDAIFSELGISNGNMNGQVKILFENAVKAANDPDIKLKIGQPLSPDQIKLLDEYGIGPILWPVDNNGILVMRLYITEAILQDSYLTANFQIENSILELNSDAFNTGIITSIGNSLIKATNILNYGAIKGNGKLEIEARKNIILAIVTKTIELWSHSYHYIETKTLNEVNINFDGYLYLKAGENFVTAGDVNIEAKFIAIEAGDKVFILPVALYTKLENFWRKGYSKREELVNLLTSLKATEGGITITSVNGNMLYAPSFESVTGNKVNCELGSNQIITVVNKASNEYLNKQKRLLGSKTVSEKSYDERVIFPYFSGEIDFSSGESGFYQLQDTDRLNANITAGNITNPASLIFNSPQENHCYEFSQKSGFWVWKKSNSHKSCQTNIIPNQLSFGNILAGGDIAMDGIFEDPIAESLNREIYFVVNYEQYIQLDTGEKAEAYFTATANLDEVSIGAGIRRVTTSSILIENAPITSKIIGVNARFTAKNGTIHFYGTEIDVSNLLKIKAQSSMYHAVYNEITQEARRIDLEIGYKIGIQSAIGALVRSSQNLASSLESLSEGGSDGSDKNTAIAAVNTVFSIIGIINAIGVLANGGMIMPFSGLVVNLNLQMIKEVRKIANIASFKVGRIEIDSGNIGGNVFNLEADSGYIHAQIMELKTAYSQYESYTRNRGTGVDIYLSTAGLGGSVGVNGANIKSHEIVPLHAVMKIKNGFEITIRGRASLEGISILADDLDAFFGQLILRSVEQVYNMDMKGVGITIGDALAKGAIQGQLAKYGGSSVRHLTAIIGQDKANIVIAHSLTMIGSMIMNGDYDETGQLTDKGQLMLKVTELYYQHISCIDEGYSFGAAINVGQTLAKQEGNPYASEYQLMYGDREKITKTNPTVGGGYVEINGHSVPTGQNFGTDTSGQYQPPTSDETITDGINRAVENAQEVIHNAVTDTINIIIPANIAGIGQTTDKILDGSIVDEIKTSAQTGWGQTVNFFGDMYDTAKEMMFGADDASEADEDSSVPTPSTGARAASDVTDDTTPNSQNGDFATDKMLRFKFRDNIEIEAYSYEEAYLIWLKYLDQHPESYQNSIYDNDNPLTSNKATEFMGRQLSKGAQAIVNWIGQDNIKVAVDWAKEQGKEINEFLDESGITQNLRDLRTSIKDEISETRYYQLKIAAKIIGHYIAETVGAVSGVQGAAYITTKVGQKVVLTSTKFATKNLGDGLHKPNIQKSKDHRIDAMSSEATFEMFENLHITGRMTADIANEKLYTYFKEPPFYHFTKVAEIETNGKQEFVRMYTEGKSTMHGQFVALEKDVIGLTPHQLKDLFDLPDLPTHLSKTTPQAGTKMLAGIVKDGNFGGKGTGTQFYFDKRIEKTDPNVKFEHFKKLEYK